MAKRADISVTQTAALLHFNGGGTNYLVQTPTGVLYCIYVDGASDVAYRKSTDNGVTWQEQVTVFTGTEVALSVWYDRWSGIAAGLIHLAYTESGGSDVLYRSIDTESSDTLSTETTIFNGASTATNGGLSITRARGGNLLCRGCIDAGTETFFSRSTDTGATWGSRNTTGTTTPASADQYYFCPSFSSDSQDALMLFWDASANAILAQAYDDSANSWTEGTLSSSMTDTAPATSFPHLALAVDLTNSKVLAIAWTAVDTANADLKFFSISWSGDTVTINTGTDVVTDSTDDQGLAALAIDNNRRHLYAFYTGKSDGSETVGTAVNVYYKVSTDAGSTWGAETLLTYKTYNIKWLTCTPLFILPFAVGFHNDAAGGIREIRVSAAIRGAPSLGLHPIEFGV